MKTQHVLSELKQIAAELGLEVREAKGNFRGGRCMVDGEAYVVLNSRHLPEVRVAVLAAALQEEPLDQIYIKPAVRRVLDERAEANSDAPAASHA